MLFASLPALRQAFMIFRLIFVLISFSPAVQPVVCAGKK